MEHEQTGFSGSTETTDSGSTLERSGHVSPLPSGADSEQPVKPKIEPPDSSPVDRLSSITEDSWRQYYQSPLTTADIGNSSDGQEEAPTVNILYQSYKLPSLIKFGKSFVERCGTLPTIWNNVPTVTVTNLPPVSRERTSPITTRPSVLNSDVYLTIKEEPDVISENGRTEADLQHDVSTPDGDISNPSPEASLQETPGLQHGLPLPPAAVEVKSPASNNLQHSDTAVDLVTDTVRTREMQTESSHANLPLEGATYPATDFSPSSYEPLGTGQYSILTNVVVTAAPPQYSAQVTAGYPLTSDLYRDYTQPVEQYQVTRQSAATYSESVDSTSYVERYIRQNYKGTTHGLSVDLPSPDSGIGEATVTPRDALPQIFDYSELTQAQTILQSSDEQALPPASRSSTSHTVPSRKAAWNDYSRNSESDKIQIPKIHSDVGFRYFLESPISTSQRREDDRMTYINKGQYYGISLEYIPDPERTLRSNTVKSVVLVMFREEKSFEEELKAWSFWHSRQHSMKQRILDADTKNSCGIVGQIEELTHNAIAIYWNPTESPAKISISVHCLSTDFSNQKGVRGQSLHIQIDTFDDFAERAIPIHRGYCQIKVFCDKGAERKTRDEERRAAKRKLTATGSGRKRIEEMYHPPCERSEFYSMSDLLKPPVLFIPNEDADRQSGSDLALYTIYTPSTTDDSCSVGDLPNSRPDTSTIRLLSELPNSRPDTSALRIPRDKEIKTNGQISILPHAKKIKLQPHPGDRVLLYAKRAEEEVFYPLHLIPPSLSGLTKAIENKYNIKADAIRNIYKQCKKGITVEMDDDIVKHYCNEDTFLVDVRNVEDEKCDITLIEL